MQAILQLVVPSYNLMMRAMKSVVRYQPRQMRPVEENYPVHDKELLAMHYALIKFHVHLVRERTFALYTDHASLRIAMETPPLSQRRARWLSFFSEYNFVVHYKPGNNNILADALSRRLTTILVPR